MVALGDGLPPLVVITELKLAFNLELVLQGVDRLAACDDLACRAQLARGRENDPRAANCAASWASACSASPSAAAWTS